MQKFKPFAAPVLCALSAGILSGCGLFRDPPPAPAPEEPLIVRYRNEVDPVHVRDASVRHQTQTRGGAALRSDEWPHVLWSSHYERETPKNGQKREADPNAASASGTSGQEKSVHAENQDASTSVRKDVSIYAKKQSEEKASANSQKSTVVHQYGAAKIGGHKLNVVMFDGKTFLWTNPVSKDSWIGSVDSDRITLFRFEEGGTRIATIVESAYAGKDLGTINGRPVRSRSVRITVDCTGHRTVETQGAAYDDYFGRGNVVEGHASDFKPDDVEIVRRMMKAACAVVE